MRHERAPPVGATAAAHRPPIVAGAAARGLVPLLVLAIGALCPAPAETASAAEAAAAQPPPPGPHRPLKSGLEERVRLLTVELDLDPKQQAQLRKLLEAQRDQVKAVGSDTSAPPAQRISATQAISDRTADRIRALLNDEQRKKYFAKRQPRPTAQDPSVPGLEYWMEQSKAK